MKKKKESSRLHILFVVMILAALVSFIAALCLFDYDFDVPLSAMWQANMPSFILLGVFAAINIALIVSAVVLRVKNDELTKSEVPLAFMITAVIVLETVFCVPIFILWIAELIHDAIRDFKHERI